MEQFMDYEEFVGEINRFLNETEKHRKFGIALLQLNDALQKVEQAYRELMEDAA